MKKEYLQKKITELLSLLDDQLCVEEIERIGDSDTGVEFLVWITTNDSIMFSLVAELVRLFGDSEALVTITKNTQSPALLVKVVAGDWYGKQKLWREKYTKVKYIKR